MVMASKYLVPVVVIAVVAAVAIAACVIVLNNDNQEKEDDILDRIGIIGAMEVEVELLKDAMDVKKVTTISGMDFYEGKLGDRNVVLVQSGIGKVNAGTCAQTLITVFHATAVINTGVAGCLDEDLDIGDFVISKDAVQHDFDLTPLGYPKGEIPYTGKYAFEAEPSLIALAEDAVGKLVADLKYVVGRVCSGDQFIASEEQKERIVSEFGGSCCEMEGAAIAQVCYLNDVPFLVIRVMSDKADGTAPEDYPEFEKLAAMRCAFVLKYMIENL